MKKESVAATYSNRGAVRFRQNVIDVDKAVQAPIQTNLRRFQPSNFKCNI